MQRFGRDALAALPAVFVIALVAKLSGATYYIVIGAALVASLVVGGLWDRWRSKNPGDSESILYRRVYRLIRRLEAASACRADRMPTSLPSPFGISHEIIKEDQERMNRWRWRIYTKWRRPLTRRTQRRLGGILEGLASHGIKDMNMQRYRHQLPTTDEELQRLVRWLRVESADLVPGRVAARKAIAS